MQNLSIERLQNLMGTVKKAFPQSQALCAGGAPRDLLNNRPVKDIDIFIHEPIPHPQQPPEQI
jgi:tRNA nucleotidyltransferase/poly(A) polymerase